MRRRNIVALLGSLVTLQLVRPAMLFSATDPATAAAIRTGWHKLTPTGFAAEFDLTRIDRSDKEWRDLLPEDAWRVLFKEATERPFTSPLNDEKRAGIFVCRACDLPLFSSEMKFDSGTGWPSFFTAIEEHLATKQDFKLIWPRTEYHCVRCGGHQGHVFDDGPAPTRQRWCNNGVALKFLPAA